MQIGLSAFSPARPTTLPDTPTLDLTFAGATVLDSRITFTRASSATRINAAGTLVTMTTDQPRFDYSIVSSVTNLLLQSETLQTTWSVAASSVSINATVAPSGATTADKLVEDSATSTHVLQQFLAYENATAYTLSGYFKAAERTWCWMFFPAAAFTATSGAYFNLGTGTVGSTISTGVTTAIQALENGWYRCSITKTSTAAASGNSGFGLATADNVNSYAGDNASGISAWGLQLEKSSSANRYVATTAAAVTDVTTQSKGLLIEEARTNSIRNNTMVGAVPGTPGTIPTNWSVDLSGVSGISREIVGTGTENGITYIDIRLFGTSAATANAVILFDASNAAAASPSQAWAVSSYVKLQAGSLTGIASTFLEIYEYSSVPAYLRQTSAGTFTPTTAGLSTQRVSGTVTTGASTAFTRSSVTVRFTSGVAADITLRIGLPQLELGAFATSVVETTAAAATRAADVASIGTLTPWFNQPEGGLYVEWQSAPTLYARYLVSIEQAATSATRIDININSVNAVNPRTVVSGAAVATLTGGTYTGGGVAKIAFGYKSADYASSLNGAAAVTATTAGALPSSLATMYLGSITGGTQVNGWLRRVIYYPRRLSDTKLQALTS